MKELREVREALAAALDPLPASPLPLAEAIGLILAEEITADIDVAAGEVGAAREAARALGTEPAAGTLVAGAVAARAGERVAPARVGLLAAAGAAEVLAVPRPGVALISAGHELVPASVRPRGSQVRNTTAPTLEALARASGLPILVKERVPRQADAAAGALAQVSSRAPLTLFSGGPDLDAARLAREALAALDVEILVEALPLSPLDEVLLARRGSALIVALPGRPSVALAAWAALVRPLAEHLAGEASLRAPLERVPLMTALGAPLERATLLPAAHSGAGGPLAGLRLLAPRGSADDPRLLAEAECFVIVPPGETLPGGSLVEALPLA